MVRRDARRDRRTGHVDRVPGVISCSSFAEAVEGAHTALVLTGYPELVGADWTALLGSLSEPRLLFEARNCLDPATISATG